MKNFKSKHLMDQPMSFQFQTRFESLVDYYGLDLVNGVILSNDLIPRPELTKPDNSMGLWLDSNRKNSDVLRLHFQNMIATYGQDIFTANVNFLLGLDN